MIDGCSRLACIRRVVVPIMLPSIVAVFCFAFIGAWNELLAGIIFTSQPKDGTIPVGLKSLNVLICSKIYCIWIDCWGGERVENYHSRDTITEINRYKE